MCMSNGPTRTPKIWTTLIFDFANFAWNWTVYNSRFDGCFIRCNKGHIAPISIASVCTELISVELGTKRTLSTKNTDFIPYCTLRSARWRSSRKSLFAAYQIQSDNPWFRQDSRKTNQKCERKTLFFSLATFITASLFSSDLRSESAGPKIDEISRLYIPTLQSVWKTSDAKPGSRNE